MTRHCDAGGDRARQERQAGLLPGRDRPGAVPPDQGSRGGLDRLADRRLPVRAAAGRMPHGQRGVAAHGDRDRQARRPGRARPGRAVDQVRGPGTAAGRDRRTGRARGHPPAADDLRRADQGRPDRAQDRGDPRGRGHHRRPAVAAAHRAVLQDGHRRRRGHLRDPRHHGLGRACVRPGRAAQPQAVHLRAGRAGHRRRLRHAHRGAAPDADRGGGGAGRVRRRLGPHHRGGARRRRAHGHRDRGRGRGPPRLHGRVGRPVRARARRRRHDPQR